MTQYVHLIDSLSLPLSQDEKSTYFQVIVTDCPVGTLLEATAITGYSQCVCNQGRKEIVFCNRRRIYMSVSSITFITKEFKNRCTVIYTILGVLLLDIRVLLANNLLYSNFFILTCILYKLLA